MSSLQHIFGGRERVLLAVVHVHSLGQAARNVALARDNGADGVFLISHTGAVNWLGLSSIFRAIQNVQGGFWMGVNFLDLSRPTEAYAQAYEIEADGLWVDNAGLYEGMTDFTGALDMWRLVNDSRPSMLYFGGVSFKYQPGVTDDAAMAKLAADYMDVVTTSGPATSRAADPEKLRVMKAAAGNTPLGLASGVTAFNVDRYLAYVSCFLVASGISSGDFHELDGPKVRELARLIHRSDR